MVNLYITSENKYKINKKFVHQIIYFLKQELDFKIESLTFNFVSLDTILETNKKYLNHNYTTDIITFSYSEDPFCLDGDIFISVEDVKNNSVRFKCTFQEELLRVIIHGILHLVGYNDTKTFEKIKMKKVENSLVRKYTSLLKFNTIISHIN